MSSGSACRAQTVRHTQKGTIENITSSANMIINMINPYVSEGSARMQPEAFNVYGQQWVKSGRILELFEYSL